MDNLGREGEHLEFKESTTELEDGIIALSAMLNKSCSGEVLFGVRDNGDVIGMDIGKTTLKKISEAVWRNIDPSLLPIIEVHTTSDGKTYVSMSAKGNERPYIVKGVAYIRCGEENRKATQHELKAMLRSSGDYLAESNSPNQKLTFTELCLILKGKGYNVADDKRMHHSLNLINDEGKFNLQAELLSDENRFPLTIIVFNGLDRTAVSYRTDYENQSLLTEMNGILNFVKSLNETAVKVSGEPRQEQDLFNYDAFKEAWVNACVHNNWLSLMSPSVHMFDDRIEVISYGNRPYWLSEDDFFSGRSMPVNESLMRVFIQAGANEHSGHGIPIIVSEYGKNAFEFASGQIIVTLKFPRKRLAAYEREIETGYTKKELLIYDAIKGNPSMTQDMIAEITGLSKGFVIKTISKFKQSGLIKREGSRKSGNWVFMK